jgi:hypothetical protein
VTNELLCHPGSATAFVRRVHATLGRAPGGRLAARYVIEGEIGRLRIPPPATPDRADRLWQHTCCELFIARKTDDAYRELNFSPSGRWAAYAFRRYREAELPEPQLEAPSIRVRIGDGRIELEALVAAEQRSAGKMRIGLSTVVEEEGGRLSYWALKHPPGKPDFHHPDAFVVEL